MASPISGWTSSPGTIPSAGSANGTSEGSSTIWTLIFPASKESSWVRGNWSSCAESDMGERSSPRGVIGAFSVAVVVDSSVSVIIFKMFDSGFLVKLDTAIVESGCDELFAGVLGVLFVEMTVVDGEVVVEEGANVVDGFEVDDGFTVKSA